MTAAQASAANPQSSVWVSASAGTGKTKVLIDRLARLLLEGAAPSRLLCLTFTKAAAAEMRNRLTSVLGRWTKLEESALVAELTELCGAAPAQPIIERARRLFTLVLDAPGGMRIQTLHSFCQSVLKRFPVEAGVPPHFTVMDDRVGRETMQQARERVFADARRHPGGLIDQALSDITLYAHDEDVADLIADLSSERSRLARLARHLGGPDKVLAEIARVLSVDPCDTEAGIIAAACADGAFDGRSLDAVASVMLVAGKKDRDSGAKIREWLTAADRTAQFDAYLDVFFTVAGGLRAKLCYGDTEKAMPSAPETLNREALRLDAVRQHLKSLRIYRATAALLRIGYAVLEEYRTCKAHRAVLDYDDLVLTVRGLLRETSVRDWVLFKLDGGLDHVLIDEAQDTNPEQWDVVAALTEEFFVGESARPGSRTVFAVGDVKQSIYGFQRADPAGFDRMRSSFSARCAATAQTWTDVSLDTSFRSVAAVLDVVDAVFAQPGAQRGVVDDGHTIKHLAHRAGEGGTVEIWPLADAPAAVESGSWALPVDYLLEEAPDTRLAKVIAGRIHRWIQDGEILASKGRPIRAGDVLVLVRRRTRFVETLVRSLKEVGVPVAGADRMVLTDQLPVMDLLALGRFLVLPEDDLTLATVLKSPLFGLDEERLFALCHNRPGRLWDALTERRGEHPSFTAAHEELSGLLAKTDFMRPFELFSQVLGPDGGRRRILSRLGPDAIDPIEEFLSLSLAYERDHIPSLQGFLHWVESGDAEIKRDSEHGARNEVRIMTVHGAKGLQAPIVFLPDTTQTPSKGPRLLWPAADGVPLWSPRKDLDNAVCIAARNLAVDEQDREYRRLLYVAMTRAEDRLYVCGWPVGKTLAEDSWYALIQAGMGTVAQPVPMDFRDVSSCGWAGNGLRLEFSQAVAVNAHPGASIESAVAAVPSFISLPAPAEPPRATPLTPSRPLGIEPPARSPLAEDDPGGPRRGRLIHRLLELLPTLAANDRAAAARKFLANPLHGLESAEQEEIVREVLAVMDMPDLAALFGPNSQAEVPIIGDLGGHVVSGQVDRLVVLPERVVVLDYKSNRPPPTNVSKVPEIYLHQMVAYRDLLRGIYGDRPIECYLLWTFKPRLMRLDDAMLDIHRAWHENVLPA